MSTVCFDQRRTKKDAPPHTLNILYDSLPPFVCTVSFELVLTLVQHLRPVALFKLAKCINKCMNTGSLLLQKMGNSGSVFSASCLSLPVLKIWKKSCSIEQKKSYRICSTCLVLSNRLFLVYIQILLLHFVFEKTVVTAATCGTCCQLLPSWLISLSFYWPLICLPASLAECWWQFYEQN